MKKKERNFLLFATKLIVQQLILAIVFTSACFAKENMEQNLLEKEISISVHNQSMKSILNTISKNADIQFTYLSGIIPTGANISVTEKKQKLKNVLNRLLTPYALEYQVVGTQITLRKSEENLSASIGTKYMTITGKVVSADGTPLANASVKIKGSTTGTTTDEAGNFKIESDAVSGILEVTYVGYQTAEIPFTSSSTNLEITLTPDENQKQEEVVVIGYGTQKKKFITDAVATVDADDLDKTTAANFTQALQGKAPGIQVTQATGQPGANVALQIRTNPSNANAGVLYVIDGVPVNDNAGTPATATRYGTSGVDQSPLNFINPNDIESISFLKDAGSASIYGARAGAGVVLITTKKGSERKPIINYSSAYGIQKVDRLYDLLGTKDYMTQRNLINQELWAYNNKIAPYYGTVDAGSVDQPSLPYSQMQIDTTSVQPSALEAIFRQGYIHQQNISVSGGSKTTNYYLSGNYFDQKGILINSGIKRYNVKLSLDHSLGEKIKMGASMTLSNSNTQNANTGGQFENAGAVVAATYWPANLPLRGEDGNSYPLNPSYQNTPNPLSYETVTDFTVSTRSLTSGYLQWEVLKGLMAKVTLNYDQSQNKRNSYFPITFLYGAQANGAAAININQSNSLSNEWTLNYKKNFLDNNLEMDVLGGYSYQRTNWEGVGAGNQQFISDQLLYYNLGAGQAITPSVSSFRGQTTWVSGFSRAAFIFLRKYALKASLRADAASNFAQNKKWGYFPSVSASWSIADENFMQSISAVSDLKLRVGYGETGNSSFGGSAFELYQLNAGPIFGINQPYTGISLTQAPNPNLSWETAGEWNLGLDFGLFKNRLTGSFDIYSKTIRNMLSQIPLPSDNITSFVWGNSGSVRANGWELGLSSKNIVANNPGNFTWNTVLNLSHYYSYWVERAPEAMAALQATPWVNATGKNAPLNGVYGYEADGIYTGTWGEQPAWMPGMLPGGLIIKDINGFDENGNLTGTPDGRLNAADQKLLFNWQPKVLVGFGNNFTFKNLDLDVFFSGAVQKGGDPNAGLGSNSMNSRMVLYGWNVLNNVADRWAYTNPNGFLPTGITDPTYSTFQGNSSYYYVNSSYLRCRNITLGYSLGQKVVEKQKVFSSIRIYADFQNLFTITSKEYKGMDPELNQGNYYPFNKSYMLGLNVTF